MLTICNARVITPTGILDSGAVRIEKPRIAGVLLDNQKRFSGTTIDAKGLYLSPGFIELHAHGGDGADFMDGTLEAFRTICGFHASHGVTALQATTIAAPLESIIEVLEKARWWRDESVCNGSQLIGVHLEGPFLNPEQAGAQPPRSVRHPSRKEWTRLIEYSDIITEMTLAPELPNALELIREMHDRGVVVSAGHSQAHEEEILAAVRAGLKHVTHIYSSMSSVVREGPWRIPGLLETALMCDDLTTEIIADGKHLPPLLMQLVFKCKGLDRLCLVSDATRGAGMMEGTSFLLGDQKAVIQDGVAMLSDRSSFAGSATPLDRMVRNAAEILRLPLGQVVQMVTDTPARVLGIEARKGSIEAGKDADLVLFDEHVRIYMTIIGGEVVYSSLPTSNPIDR
jgi:N-acetylglucosamine-6-phosphate deacetylase